MRRTLAMLAMVCALGSPALAEDGPEADAKATPVSIHQVLSGGYWEHGKDDGHYRVIVVTQGFEHISHRLLIQWIMIDHDNHDIKVVRTVAVTEVSDLSGVVHDLKLQPRTQGPLRLSFTLEGRDGKKRKRTVTATADGKYTIR